MARGRMINQSIATDKRLNLLSIEAQLVYLMAIPHLDRDGLILGESYMLASQVCPRRPELAAGMIDIIAEWIALGLVMQYEGKEDPILFFVGFSKNQGGLRYDRETPSQFPPPPGYRRIETGLEPDPNYMPSRDSGNSPTLFRQQSDSTPAEGNRKEEKRKVGGERPPTPQHRTRADYARQQSARRMTREYLDVDAKLLTALANQVKRIYGYTVLIDKPGDDSIEDKMRDEAYRLWDLGFDTEEKMVTLNTAWRERAAAFKDKRPYGDQLYQEAVQLISDQSIATSAAVVDISVGEYL